MKIITHRQHHEEKSYRHYYEWAHLKGTGFSFPCNEKGEVFKEKLHPAARMNLFNCQQGFSISHNDAGRDVTYPILDKGILEDVNRWTTPAVGECNHCGTHVTLAGFTNTCPKCHADYNMGGQELASRSQWGEETGESVSDILSVDTTPTEELLDPKD